jgi:hypothetical protein
VAGVMSRSRSWSWRRIGGKSSDVVQEDEKDVDVTERGIGSETGYWRW